MAITLYYPKKSAQDFQRVVVTVLEDGQTKKMVQFENQSTLLLD